MWIQVSDHATYRDLGVCLLNSDSSFVVTFSAMRRSCFVILAALLVAGIAASVDLQLVVTKKTPLKGELEELVTFGLLKEMTCDSTGNILTQLCAFHTTPARSRHFPLIH